MVYVQLTNGFGNNLFQYIAGRLLATFHGQEVVAVPPTPDYYGIREFEKIGIALHNTEIPNCELVSDINYTHFFNSKYKNSDFVIRGYFENYKYFKNNIDLIKTWFPDIKNKNENDLVLHFRAGDRLFYANEYDSKPQAQNFVNAIQQFNFDNLYIVTDMPEWEQISPQQLNNMKFHVNVEEDKRVSPQQSVDYFNSIVEGLSQFNPIHRKNSVAEDFSFIRCFNNILFQHGTLCWWAAALSDAKKVGVYGPWRPWKGASNKNLSDVNLEGWFKWI
tara:strand:- start:7516 stop:8343 length:828 start_codon:yes stop_codon:yes gene_type:complete